MTEKREIAPPTQRTTFLQVCGVAASLAIVVIITVATGGRVSGGGA